MRVVLDASVVIELVLGTEPGVQIRDRVADPRISLHSPELVDLEVLNVLRRYERTGTVSPDRVAEAFRNLLDLDLVRHGHGVLLERVWARRRNLTAYDAAYVALAEILDAPLLTTDGRLARVPRLPIAVEVFAPSTPGSPT
ncbi:type II toxin-antitoxin system VapC family toxin [Candidatus Palauibacter sp.]|uniref:type II toxin-antitoxin system VapC family toxin n=1 Tax=Candidatus Palauibacter sp. TaxID=3101350 RepID=UPI003C6EB5F0